VSHVFKASRSATVQSNHLMGTIGLFEENDGEAEAKRVMAKELSQVIANTPIIVAVLMELVLALQSVMKVAAECARKSSVLEGLSRNEKLRLMLGKEAAALFDDVVAAPGEEVVDRGAFSFSAKRDESANRSVAAESGDAAGRVDPSDIAEVEAKLIQQIHKWLNYVSI
jgi:hypothetical protein